MKTNFFSLLPCFVLLPSLSLAEDEQATHETSALETAAVVQNEVSACDFDRFFEDVLAIKEIRQQRLLSEAEFAQACAEEGVVILDARAAEFFAKLHVQGAVNLPFTHFSAEALEELIPAKDTRILLYCRNNLADAKQADMQGFPVTPHIPADWQDKQTATEKTEDESSSPQHAYPGEYDPPEIHKKRSVGLNLSTFIALYSYGYENVWELNDIVDANDSSLVFESQASSED